MTDNTRPAPDGDALDAVAEVLRTSDPVRTEEGPEGVAEVILDALTALGWCPPAPGTVTVNADDLRDAARAPGTVNCPRRRQRGEVMDTTEARRLAEYVRAHRYTTGRYAKILARYALALADAVDAAQAPGTAVVNADDLREVLGFGYAGEDILEVRSRLRAALGPENTP